MKKIIFLLFLFLFLSGCGTNKVLIKEMSQRYPSCKIKNVSEEKGNMYRISMYCIDRGETIKMIKRVKKR